MNWWTPKLPNINGGHPENILIRKYLQAENTYEHGGYGVSTQC